MDKTQKHDRPSYCFFSVMLPLFAGVILALGGCAGDNGEDTSEVDSEPASDLAALNSEYATTPYETDYADVHRVSLPAGSEIAPHEGGERGIYSLSAYAIQLETDGTASEQTFEAGDAHYHEGGVHTVANTGNQLASYIVFERTSPPPSATASEGEMLDTTSLPDGASHEVLLENDRMAMHRIMLDPGASIPPHYGYPRIIYTLSDYTLTFIDPDSDTRNEQSFSEGDLHDHEAGMHAVENTGDQRAEYLAVVFKQ